MGNGKLEMAQLNIFVFTKLMCPYIVVQVSSMPNALFHMLSSFMFTGLQHVQRAYHP